MIYVMKYWLPVVIWGAAIFILSGIPDLRTDLSYDFTLRKCAHIFEYFVLTALIFRAVKATWAISYKSTAFISAVGAFVYAISDEYHQTFVPGRHGAWQDIFIDAIGILALYLIIVFIQRKRKTR